MTVPNSFIMSSHTVNYSTSAREYGLIIHSEVSIGYDVPWRQVNQILIDAALNTPGVVDDPRPFVLETSLSDWYPVYQINAYIKQADKMAQIYSDLHQNIQDKFNEAGIEIMSPHYMAVRDGNESTTPKEYQKAIILLIKPEKKVNLNSFSIYPSYPFIRQLVLFITSVTPRTVYYMKVVFCRTFYTIVFGLHLLGILATVVFCIMNIKTSVSQPFAVTECDTDDFHFCVETAYESCSVFQLFSSELYIGNR